MDSLPIEVLRIICMPLGFRDAANLRFVSRNLSVVAAEFLVTRVCFHTSQASLQRLESISKHPVFSQTVRMLVYEAALLADVRCRHEYMRHFELDHHGLERPPDPSPTSSERERRLCRRNRSKWMDNIGEKYDAYRSLFDMQKSLLEENVLDEVLSRCIPRFAKLRIIDVDPVRKCSHMTSRRFIDEFGYDCASPLSGHFGWISEQFRCIFLPNNRVIQSLRKIDINSLSPSFFKESQKDLLMAAFCHLTDIDIVLKLADGDMKHGEPPRASFRRLFSNGVFRDTISSANDLEFVTIGIESGFPYFGTVSDIFSKKTWPRLRSIGLSAITSTQRDFMDLLKRQPKLEYVNLSLMQLTEGSWPETLNEMRHQLNLKTFSPVGYLEDPLESWPMDLLNVPIYIESYEEFELSTAIDMYVTNKGSAFLMGERELMNPLGEGFSDFEEGDLVRDMYGTLSDLENMPLEELFSDSMSLDGLSDDDLSQSTDSDISMSDVQTGI